MGETSSQLVARLSAKKADAINDKMVLAHCKSKGLRLPNTLLVLGADTVIDLNGRILGKPQSEEDAFAMLTSLSNTVHQVITGITVRSIGGSSDTITVTSDVHFASVSEDQIRAYWQSGEPQDKAGSYAIQGMGARFISHLSGSYSNVVGLPLFETARLLEKHGLQDHV